MRTTFLCLLALPAVLCAAPAGGEPDRVERALRKLRQEFVSARNAGDLERAMACWSADARIMIAKDGRASRVLHARDGPCDRRTADNRVWRTVRRHR